MDICYDCEFLEDGRTIDLISIGMVAEDGREYYAVHDAPGTIYRAAQHEWLRANVLPHLPVLPDWYHVPWDRSHPDFGYVKRREVIAAEVQDFLLATPQPQLWGWYCAHDFIALTQIWGRLIDVPVGVPRRTNDLKQECVRLGDPQVPEQASGEHNALADARRNWEIKRFLADLEERRAA